MDNNIKLSYFKGVSKFKFIDGIFSKVADKLEDKELEFYNIDLESINKIQTENVEENEFLYNLVSIISNVETDVTLAEFNKMCMYPSLEFSSYIDLLLEHYKNMFVNAKKMAEITNKTEKFIQDETGKNIKLDEFIKLAKEAENESKEND